MPEKSSSSASSSSDSEDSSKNSSQSSNSDPEPLSKRQRKESSLSVSPPPVPPQSQNIQTTNKLASVISETSEKDVSQDSTAVREKRGKSNEKRQRTRSRSRDKRKSRSRSPRSPTKSKNYDSRRRVEEERMRRSPSEESIDRYWGGKVPRDERKKSKDVNYVDRDAKYVGKRYYDDGKEDKEQDKSKTPERKFEKDPMQLPERQRKVVDILTSKTGGAYIPPAKLRMMQAEITDKSSIAFQRIAWEALKKSIHGYINKVNVDNIGIITRELLKENIVRGRGLLSKSIIQAQAASPTFTHVYAALVSIINSKFPNIGELLLKRLVIQFKRGFRRNDKAICLSSSRFIAHLVNQRVAHEILALEILTLLVETPTDDSVEVAIAFLKECGQKLTEVSGKGVNAIFEMLKNILHEGKLDKRVQYMIEVVFQVRKDGFKDHIAVIEALELVEEDDQFTHLVMLDEATDTQDMLSKLYYTYIYYTMCFTDSG